MNLEQNVKWMIPEIMQVIVLNEEFLVLFSLMCEFTRSAVFESLVVFTSIVSLI